MIEIREIEPNEYDAVGALTVRTYRAQDGMPDIEAMPDYYAMLSDVASRMAQYPFVRVLVARDAERGILGAVTYYSDMQYYGSGGTAPQERGAAGVRLLAVDAMARGRGIGRMLTAHCINLARESGQKQVILHTTKAMQVAWRMYEKIGFYRSQDLDFMQGPLPVFGFRLLLEEKVNNRPPRELSV